MGARSKVVTLTAECASKNARDLVVKRILVAEGDHVEADALLLVTEFYKVVTELTAPAAGTIEKIHVSVNDELEIGDRLVDFRLDLG